MAHWTRGAPEILRKERRMDSTAAESLLALAEELSPSLTSQDPTDALERLDTRADELEAAIGWFVDAERMDEALRLANALYRLWILKRRFTDGDRVFARVLEPETGDDRLRGRAYLWAGFMPFWMGDDDRASALFGRSLALARQIGDAQLTSQALGGLARVEFRRDVPRGRQLAHEALEVSEAAGDEAARSNALHLLGVGAQIAGDLTEARRWMTERLALVRTKGNDFLVASEAANLSMVERQLGNLDVAEELEREALVIGERIGDEFTKPFAVIGLAAIATERGQHNRAATLLGAVEKMMAAQHMEWPPDERPHYEKMLADLPAAMGAADFERARSAGQSMAAADAVALALNAPSAAPGT
jgi:tetratricopeptide (TPR) repeat protein